MPYEDAGTQVSSVIRSGFDVFTHSGHLQLIGEVVRCVESVIVSPEVIVIHNAVLIQPGDCEAERATIVATTDTHTGRNCFTGFPPLLPVVGLWNQRREFSSRPPVAHQSAIKG